MRGPLRFGSVCSGIEAASAAWEPLGWQPAWFAEIDAFPSAVLAHHYPGVPNLGDMTRLPALILAGEVEAPDVFVGGTPCQSFSVAGLRKGLDDPRGQLTRSFVEIADAIDTVRAAQGLPPAIILWENVPGVLSDNGNAFGNFLGALAGEDIALDPSGGKWTNAGLVLGPTREVCWRVLDAQYFGVAQRRRRVFVVASSRTGGVRASQVLLVESGVRRDSPPSREAGQGTSSPAVRSADAGDEGRGDGTGSDGGRGGGVDAQAAAYTFRADAMREGTAKTPSADAEGRVRLRDPGMGMYEELAPTLDCGQPHGVAHVVAPPLTATNDPSRSPQSAEVTAQVEAVLRAQTIALPVMAHGQANAEIRADGGAPTLTCNHEAPIAVTPIVPALAVDTYNASAIGTFVSTDVSGTLMKHNGAGPGETQNAAYVLTHMAVRRLTPRECERLQGFPDDYTRIPWKKKPADECPDGPRYKALGNSMAVPCMNWLGRKIDKEYRKRHEAL